MTIVKEGYLHKLGGFLKNWKKRYFVLTQNALLYLEDASKASAPNLDSVALGKIPIAGARVTLFPPETHQRPHTFGVQPEGQRRTYIVVCASRQELEEWVMAVLTVGADYDPSSPTLGEHGTDTSNADASPFSQKEGLLWKQGAIPTFITFKREFKQRYFVLDNDTLFYYRDRSSADQYYGSVPLAGADIELCSASEAVTVQEQMPPGTVVAGARNVIALTPASAGSSAIARRWVLVAQDEPTARAWVAALQSNSAPASASAAPSPDNGPASVPRGAPRPPALTVPSASGSGSVSVSVSGTGTGAGAGADPDAGSLASPSSAGREGVVGTFSGVLNGMASPTSRSGASNPASTAAPSHGGSGGVPPPPPPPLPVPASSSASSGTVGPAPVHSSAAAPTGGYNPPPSSAAAAAAAAAAASGAAGGAGGEGTRTELAGPALDAFFARLAAAPSASAAASVAGPSGSAAAGAGPASSSVPGGSSSPSSAADCEALVHSHRNAVTAGWVLRWDDKRLVWRRRWLVVSRSTKTLRYWSSPEDINAKSKPIKAAPLMDAVCAPHNDLKCPHCAVPANPAGADVVFTVVPIKGWRGETPIPGRCMVFAAPSPSLRAQWLSALADATSPTEDADDEPAPSASPSVSRAAAPVAAGQADAPVSIAAAGPPKPPAMPRTMAPGAKRFSVMVSRAAATAAGAGAGAGNGAAADDDKVEVAVMAARSSLPRSPTVIAEARSARVEARIVTVAEERLALAASSATPEGAASGKRRVTKTEHAEALVEDWLRVCEGDVVELLRTAHIIVPSAPRAFLDGAVGSVGSLEADAIAVRLAFKETARVLKDIAQLPEGERELAEVVYEVLSDAYAVHQHEVGKQLQHQQS